MNKGATEVKAETCPNSTTHKQRLEISEREARRKERERQREAGIGRERQGESLCRKK